MALTATEAAKTKFLRTGRGYARRDVERFKRRVVYALATLEENLGRELGLTQQEINEAAFPWVVGGYDYEDVDDFLERAGRILGAYERSQPGYSSLPQPRAIESLSSDVAAAATFTVVFRGYNLREVDRFMDRVSGTLYAYETGKPSPLVDAPEVARKVFSVSMRGYAEQEVDAMLDQAAETISRFELDFRRSSATGTGY